ncbi:MAG: DNA replication/repair protein RecF [Gammaproteobacteria bacterium]|nr:DNA replication/repair protein RecF [Gammaproteobacteria bacterium]
MALGRLDITAVRNLQQVSLRDLGMINVFYGANGGGKTSLLESIYLLGMARSFRSAQINSVIQHEARSCTVYGELRRPEGGYSIVGVTRERTGGVQIKINGSSVTSVSVLAEYLPLQVINARSFDLLTGSPVDRRRFLDWGVFHVEHHYHGVWQRFQKCIKQRNSLLRHGKISAGELRPWSQEFSEAGEQVDLQRQAYFGVLQPALSGLLERLSPSLPALELRYRRGWDKQSSLLQALQSTEKTDREQGYTHVGPQRADLKLLCDGRDAGAILSRGQQKLVVCALKLAQGQLLAQQRGRTCIYLVDDLPSELDAEHCRRVCDVLGELNTQVFISCIEKEDIGSSWSDPGLLESGAVFHVERGVVRRD